MRVCVSWPLLSQVTFKLLCVCVCVCVCVCCVLFERVSVLCVCVCCVFFLIKFSNRSRWNWYDEAVKAETPSAIWFFYVIKGNNWCSNESDWQVGWLPRFGSVLNCTPFVLGQQQQLLLLYFCPSGCTSDLGSNNSFFVVFFYTSPVPFLRSQLLKWRRKAFTSQSVLRSDGVRSQGGGRGDLNRSVGRYQYQRACTVLTSRHHCRGCDGVRFDQQRFSVWQHAQAPESIRFEVKSHPLRRTHPWYHTHIHTRPLSLSHTHTHHHHHRQQ